MSYIERKDRVNAKRTIKQMTYIIIYIICIHTNIYIYLLMYTTIDSIYGVLTILLLKSVPQPYEVGTIVLTVQIRTYTETESQRRQIISPRP